MCSVSFFTLIYVARQHRQTYVQDLNSPIAYIRIVTFCMIVKQPSKKERRQIINKHTFNGLTAGVKRYWERIFQFVILGTRCMLEGFVKKKNVK